MSFGDLFKKAGSLFAPSGGTSWLIPAAGAALAGYGAYKGASDQRKHDTAMRGLQNEYDYASDPGWSYAPPVHDMSGDTRAAIERINQVFAGREGAYDALGEASFDLSEKELDKLSEEVGRNLKFDLARAGLSGGSVDIDKRSDLQGRHQRGILMARNYADDLADMQRAQDYQLRQQMIGEALSTMGISGGGMGIPGGPVFNNIRAGAMPGLGEVFSGLLGKIGARGRGGPIYQSGGYV